MGIADEFKKSMGEGVEAIVNRRCVFCWMDLAVKGKKKEYSTIGMESRFK